MEAGEDFFEGGVVGFEGECAGDLFDGGGDLWLAAESDIPQ